MNRRRKASVIATCCIIAMAVIGGSFAYWNYMSEIKNPFDTQKYGSTVTENFSPADGENWQPGAEVNKDVTAVNTGDVDIIVRARLDETWTYKGEAVAYKNSADPGTGYDAYTVNQADASDGLTAADKSVVTKNFSGSANWIAAADGWYYYKVNLAGGATSDKWLDSVELIDDLDVGNLVTKYYVSASNDPDPSLWVWYEYAGSMPSYIDAAGNPCAAGDVGAQKVLHNKADTGYGTPAQKGYSDSNYELKLTVQTVQATQEALDAVFGGGVHFAAPAGTSWTLH